MLTTQLKDIWIATVKAIIRKSRSLSFLLKQIKIKSNLSIGHASIDFYSLRDQRGEKGQKTFVFRKLNSCTFKGAVATDMVSIFFVINCPYFIAVFT